MITIELSEEEKRDIDLKVQDLLNKGKYEELMVIIKKYNLGEFLILKSDAIEKYLLKERQCDKIETIVIDDETYFIDTQAKEFEVGNRRLKFIKEHLPTDF